MPDFCFRFRSRFQCSRFGVFTQEPTTNEVSTPEATTDLGAQVCAHFEPSLDAIRLRSDVMN